MKNKLQVLVVAMVVFAFTLSMNPVVMCANVGDETVEGSFTATGELNVSVNASTLAFGSISAGSSGTGELKVTNNGDVPADVTQDQVVHNGTGSMTVGTAGGLTDNEFSVEMWSNGGTSAWDDAGADGNGVIASDLAIGATEQNYTLKVTLDDTVPGESDANGFYANITAIEHSA